MAADIIPITGPSPDLTDLTDVGFSARLLCQVSLPYQQPKGLAPGQPWTRRNGNVTLSVQPAVLDEGDETRPARYGFPYGLYPRLIMLWITEEVVRTGEQHLEMGSSMNAFLEELGLSTDGRTHRRVRDQLDRLTLSTLFLKHKSEEAQDDGSTLHGKGGQRLNVADGYEFWWRDRPQGQPALFDEEKRNVLHLSQRFYDEVREHHVPINRQTIARLHAGGKSGLAIDLYLWLSHRLFALKKPARMSWQQLHMQFGSTSHLRAFRAQFRKALAEVQTEYPAAKVDATDSSIVVLKPSKPHVAPRLAARYRIGSRDPQLL